MVMKTSFSSSMMYHPVPIILFNVDMDAGGSLTGLLVASLTPDQPIDLNSQAIRTKATTVLSSRFRLFFPEYYV